MIFQAFVYPSPQVKEQETLGLVCACVWVCFDIWNLVDSLGLCWVFYFRYNSLARLTEMDFSGLNKLELLMLHSNGIHTIPAKTFSDLQALQVRTVRVSGSFKKREVLPNAGYSWRVQKSKFCKLEVDIKEDMKEWISY